MCLAYTGQERIPTTEFDKEKLYQAGLGEKEVVFDDLDLSEEDFKEVILQAFPRLRAGGGFRFLKGTHFIFIQSLGSTLVTTFRYTQQA